MQFEQTESKSIGEKVSILRHLCGQTQIQFTSVVYMTRAHLARLEGIKHNNEIKMPTFFTLYYAMSRIIESNPVGYIAYVAQQIKDDVVKEIEKTDS